MGTLGTSEEEVQAHTKAGIKIQPKITKIFQLEVEYLGHKVSTNVRGLYQECAELATINWL